MRSALGWKSGAALRRAPVWMGMAAIVAMSWLYLVRLGGSMSAMGGGAAAHAGMAMGEAGASPLVAVFAMWAVMMMAMMLPTVAPSAAVFSSLTARRDPRRGGGSATAVYVAGYATAWIAFAAPAALMQWALTHSRLLDPMARSTSVLLSAAILFGAGLYQFTPLKSACLSRCRSPLAFFMAKWRDGAVGALVLGLAHGSYCVACCWALMTVMFVVGAMNLAWMGLLAVLVLGEKVIPAGWRFDQVIGATLVVSGLWVAANAWSVA